MPLLERENDTIESKQGSRSGIQSFIDLTCHNASTAIAGWRRVERICKGCIALQVCYFGDVRRRLDEP